MVGEEPTIREAEGGDLPALVEIERSVQPRPWSRGALAAELGLPHSHVFVGEVGGRVVGYSIFRQIGDEADVLNVAVARGFQRAGLGRRLMSVQIEAARSRGARIVDLDVHRGNDPARALYRSLGFREAGERRDYYGRGQPAVRMRLGLRTPPPIRR